MRPAKFALLFTLASLAGCVTGYTLVEPGVQTLGELQVTAGDRWNMAPNNFVVAARKDSQIWTQDGLLLDRMVIIPGVADGDTIFVSRDKSAALPAFHADMLPNEIEELVESSIVKLYGEGSTAVSTSNLRPQTFGENSGFMFDVQAAVTESPDYRGLVGAFVVDEKLYMVAYLAADPYYYDKHAAQAEAIIKSALIKRAGD